MRIQIKCILKNSNFLFLPFQSKVNKVQPPFNFHSKVHNLSIYQHLLKQTTSLRIYPQPLLSFDLRSDSVFIFLTAAQTFCLYEPYECCTLGSHHLVNTILLFVPWDPHWQINSVDDLMILASSLFSVILSSNLQSRLNKLVLLVLLTYSSKSHMDIYLI